MTKRKRNRRTAGHGPAVETVADAQPAEAMPDPWYTVTAQAPTAEGSSTRIDISGRIGWWPTTAEMFCADLALIKTDNIDLVLNSPGGDVWQGIQMYNALRSHDANIHVEVQSIAASAASIVAQAGDSIHMARASMMMVHEARTGLHGDADSFRDAADLLDKINEQMAGVYAAHAGGTEAEWLETMAGEQWFSGPEAVDAGLADTAEAGDDGSEALAEHAFAAMVANNGFVLIENEYRYNGRAECPAPEGRDAERVAGEAPDRVDWASLTLDAVDSGPHMAEVIQRLGDGHRDAISREAIARAFAVPVGLVDPDRPATADELVHELREAREAFEVTAERISSEIERLAAEQDLHAGTGEEEEDLASAAAAEVLEVIRLSALEALST